MQKQSGLKITAFIFFCRQERRGGELNVIRASTTTAGATANISKWEFVCVGNRRRWPVTSTDWLHARRIPEDEDDVQNRELSPLSTLYKMISHKRNQTQQQTCSFVFPALWLTPSVRVNERKGGTEVYPVLPRLRERKRPKEVERESERAGPAPIGRH